MAEQHKLRSGKILNFRRCNRTAAGTAVDATSSTAAAAAAETTAGTASSAAVVSASSAAAAAAAETAADAAPNTAAHPAAETAAEFYSKCGGIREMIKKFPELATGRHFVYICPAKGISVRAQFAADAKFRFPDGSEHKHSISIRDWLAAQCGEKIWESLGKTASMLRIAFTNFNRGVANFNGTVMNFNGAIANFNGTAMNFNGTVASFDGNVKKLHGDVGRKNFRLSEIWTKFNGSAQTDADRKEFLDKFATEFHPEEPAVLLKPSAKNLLSKGCPGISKHLVADERRIMKIIENYCIFISNRQIYLKYFQNFLAGFVGISFDQE